MTAVQGCVEEALDRMFSQGPLSALGDWPRDAARENFRRILVDVIESWAVLDSAPIDDDDA